MSRVCTTLLHLKTSIIEYHPNRRMILQSGIRRYRNPNFKIRIKIPSSNWDWLSKYKFHAYRTREYTTYWIHSDEQIPTSGLPFVLVILYCDLWSCWPRRWPKLQGREWRRDKPSADVRESISNCMHYNIIIC